MKLNRLWFFQNDP